MGRQKVLDVSWTAVHAFSFSVTYTIANLSTPAATRTSFFHPSPPVLPSFGSFPAHASDPRPLLRRDPFESPITSNNGAHTRRPDLVLLIPTSQCFISLLGLVLVPLLLQSSIFPWRVRCVTACPINPLWPNHQLFQRQARCRRGGKGRQIRQWCSGATLILERHRTRSRERKWYVLHKGV